MKHSIMPPRRTRNQRGFSVLEILIAIVLISLLVASGLYYANVGDKAAAVDIAAAKAAIVVRFPEALMMVYALKQTFDDADADDLTATGSVRTDSPVPWEIAGDDDAPTADTLSVKLTFTGDSQAEAVHDYLQDNIDTTMVEEVSRGESEESNVLTVKYSVK